MATLRDLKKIIAKYHFRAKKFHREETNALWQEVYKLFKQVETSGEVEKKPQTKEHLTKKYCKYCNRRVNLEEYNLAEEICLKCYNENVDDEQETGNE